MPTPQSLATVAETYLPQPHAALLNGMLLGLPISEYKDLYIKLKMVGLLHMVVLSGMNITIMTSIVMRIMSVFGRRMAGLLSVLTIIIFIAFVSPQAPVVRAGFCSIFTIVALLLGRKTQPLYALFLSAIFVGIFWPKWITSISFQLSYGATLGLLLFGTSNQKKARTLRSKFMQEFKSEFKTSIAAQLFTAPLIFFHFKQFSIIAPIANVPVCFMVGPIMIVGFITVILGKISYVWGMLPAFIVYSMLDYILWVADTLVKIPFVFIQI